MAPTNTAPATAVGNAAPPVEVAAASSKDCAGTGVSVITVTVDAEILLVDDKLAVVLVVVSVLADSDVVVIRPSAELKAPGMSVASGIKNVLTSVGRL
jgi:hypothetical protein